MKFLFAETSDTVDPGYDFARLRQGRTRRVHTGDEYPHEHMDRAPYDGLLVSRAAFSDHNSSGKYSIAKTMRFRREGARRFLRYPEGEHPGSMLMGRAGLKKLILLGWVLVSAPMLTFLAEYVASIHIFWGPLWARGGNQ